LAYLLVLPGSRARIVRCGGRYDPQLVKRSSEWVSEWCLLFSFPRFKCSIDHAKRLFSKPANSVFGKIGRIASEEVTLQLVKSKCIPILLYGLEVCELSKSQMASLDFGINRFFTKLFSTSNTEIVKSCQEFFGFELPSTLFLCCPNA